MTTVPFVLSNERDGVLPETHNVVEPRSGSSANPEAKCTVVCGRE